MAGQPSPYTPGEIAAQVPGRGEELGDIADSLAVVRGRRRLAGRIRVEVGPRGVGKTSLLREAQRQAGAAGMDTVFVTAGHDDLLPALVDALGRGPLRWEGDVLRDRVAELTMTLGPPGAQASATFRPHRSPGTLRAVEDLLRQAAAASGEDGRTGLVLFIDELQAGDAESLRALAYVWQDLQARPEDLPLALVAAGLGHTEDVVTDAASFSERFAYRPVASISDAAAREALTVPATALGVSWEMAALTQVVGRAQGYPYFVQVYGDAVWRAAGSPAAGTVLTTAHVEASQHGVDRDVDALYRSRWAKATPSEQRFLTAMADSEDADVRRGFIADRLDVPTAALGMPRRSLMDKGLVEVAGHGRLRFTVPGFRGYVLEQAGDGRP